MKTSSFMFSKNYMIFYYYFKSRIVDKYSCYEFKIVETFLNQLKYYDNFHEVMNAEFKLKN